MRHYFTTSAVALVLGIGVLVASGTLRASDTEPVSLDATVVEPIVITVANGINFGRVSGVAGSTIAIDNLNARVGGLGGIPVNGGPTAAAATYSITCDNTLNIQASFGTVTMSAGYTVTAFTMVPNLTASTLCADQAGVKIGATLTFPGAPPNGAQTGTVPLTVAYP